MNAAAPKTLQKYIFLRYFLSDLPLFVHFCLLFMLYIFIKQPLTLFYKQPFVAIFIPSQWSTVKGRYFTSVTVPVRSISVPSGILYSMYQT